MKEDDHSASPSPWERHYFRRLTETPELSLDASESDLLALDFLDQARWPSGVQCPRCDSANLVLLTRAEDARRRKRRCRDCQMQFTPTSGTILASEKASPSDLVFSLGLATQQANLQLRQSLSRALGVSSLAAGRLALKLEFIVAERARDPKHADLSELDPDRDAEDTLRRAMFSVDKRRRRRRLIAVIPWLASAALLAVSVVGAMTASDPPIESAWVHNGERRAAITERRQGESLADWHSRHIEVVAAFKNVFPPDSRSRK